MEILQTPLQGVVLIQPKAFADERGYFYEAFSEERYKDVCGAVRFVQDNVSRSMKNVVRGLHYQVGEYAQGKLCKVLYGKVIDAAVDIRFGSPTFGQYFAAALSDENHRQLWIPPGFAHGFSVLSDEAVFHYKCTAYYSKAHEKAILFNDPDVNIQWNVEHPIVSPKDLVASSLKNIDRDFIFS
jgi:dTDP-4-dehydrorhamnose 3,5-epimerase